MSGRYPDRPEQASDGKAFEDMAANVLIDLFGFDERCRAFPDKTRQFNVGESPAGVEYKELKKAGKKCKVILVTHAPFVEGNITRSILSKLVVKFYDLTFGPLTINKFDKI